MSRWSVFAGLAVSVALVAGCTTPSKSSRIESLIGEAAPGLKESKVLDDISRTIFILKKRPLTAEEKRSPVRTKDYETTQTSTWLKVYPYTNPLISTRIRSRLAETGFKERWSADRIQSETNTEVAAESKRLVSDKQCFAVEINTGDPAALELKYWYGSLVQGATNMPLKFTNGKGLVVTTTSTTVTGSHGVYSGTTSESHEYFYYANACAEKPIQLTEAFTLAIEPRYTQELLPLKLEWLKPEMPAAKK